MEQQCLKQAIYIWVGDDGKPKASPRVITVKPGDEFTFLSKEDFSIEFLGRTPDDAQSRVKSCQRLSRDGVLSVKVSPDYADAPDLFANYRDFYQQIKCTGTVPEDVLKQVRSDFNDPSLDEAAVKSIVQKAPIETKDDIFIYFNVEIDGVSLDPGVDIVRRQR